MIKKFLLNKKFLKLGIIILFILVLIIVFIKQNIKNKFEHKNIFNESFLVKDIQLKKNNFLESENFVIENFTLSAKSVDLKNKNEQKINSNKESSKVVRVVDGDTIDVLIDGKTERLRLIGINTPETVDPRKIVECFGREASNKAKELLSNKKVFLENDFLQGERDKYGRLLRYVFLENEINFNLMMIKEGYAYEYTYNLPYKYEKEFKEAQKYAENNKIGLWGEKCSGNTIQQSIIKNDGSLDKKNTNTCIIKGNISAKKEKIYHLPNCKSYNVTVIDESVGERWFCSQEEALNAGWRKALNCE